MEQSTRLLQLKEFLTIFDIPEMQDFLNMDPNPEVISARIASVRRNLNHAIRYLELVLSMEAEIAEADRTGVCSPELSFRVKTLNTYFDEVERIEYKESCRIRDMPKE